METNPIGPDDRPVLGIDSEEISVVGVHIEETAVECRRRPDPGVGESVGQIQAPDPRVVGSGRIQLHQLTRLSVSLPSGASSGWHTQVVDLARYDALFEVPA